MTLLTIDMVARCAGVTSKHMKRIVLQIRRGERDEWRAAQPIIISDAPIEFDFHSLPIEVRENYIVMRDQMPLPFGNMSTVN